MAATGDVHIAILRPQAGDETIYEGQGIQVIGNQVDKAKHEKLLAAWESFHQNNELSDDSVIAFTRPLDNKIAASANMNEFDTRARLWHPSNASASQ